MIRIPTNTSNKVRTSLALQYEHLRSIGGSVEHHGNYAIWRFTVEGNPCLRMYMNDRCKPMFDYTFPNGDHTESYVESFKMHVDSVRDNQAEMRHKGKSKRVEDGLERIRGILIDKWPTVEFVLHSVNDRTVRIHWHDGATENQVMSMLVPVIMGSYSGSEYEYEHVTDQPQVYYVNCVRFMSPNTKEALSSKESHRLLSNFAANTSGLANELFQNCPIPPDAVVKGVEASVDLNYDNASTIKLELSYE
jgi:hypothetical protein